MALPVVTIPLEPLKKWAYKLAGTAWGILEGLLDEGGDLPEGLEWRRFVMEYSRATPAGTDEDLAQIGFDVVNFTDGTIDSSWTEADHTAVHNALFAYDAAWKSLRSGDVRLVAIKGYPRSFANPMSADSRFAPSGPPVWLSVQNVPGTGAGQSLPYQVAMSVTHLTGVAHHWGRHYLPGLTEDAVTTTGRWDTADVQTAEAAAVALVQALHDADIPMVVAGTQHNSVVGPWLWKVIGIQVDDIPDVIRRRRAKQAAVREISYIA